jgi:hypothetical protein
MAGKRTVNERKENMNELQRANLRRCSGWLKMGLPKSADNPSGHSEPVTASEGENIAPGQDKSLGGAITERETAAIDHLTGKVLDLEQAIEERTVPNPNAGIVQPFPRGRW